MKTILLCLLAGLLFSGCVITHSPGFHSGYERLTPAQRTQIHFVPVGQAIPPPNGRVIYAVAARSLLQAMPRADTTLVYLWGPRCHSQQCASLQSVQVVCNQRGYQLYVVAEYYDLAQINLQAPLQHPLLAIDHQFYRTNYCPKYSRLFAAELRQGTPLPVDTQYARYYVFTGNRFVKALNALADASPQFPSQPAELPGK